MHFEAGTRPPENLEEILRILGASISQFFDRKIDYVITNLPKDRWPLQPSLSPGCSSKENVDPRSEKSPLLSTGTHPSPTVENPPLGVTRGRAMLLAVKRASKSSPAISATDQSVPGTRHTHDVLLRAQEFGIKVLTIGVVRKWIRALPEDVKMQLEIGESFFDSDTTPEKGDPELDRLWLLRPLTRPCIKIVDLKARTRPNYMENTNYMECLWRSFMGSPSAAASSVKTPALHDAPQTPTTPAGTCTTPQASVELPPSTNVVTSQRTTGPSKRDPGAKDSPGVSLIRSSYRGLSSCKRRKISTKRSRGALAEPSGYCECCSSHFNNLYAHVTGTCHMNYAENAENFRQLDQLLSELPSMKEVLAKARVAKVLNIAPPPAADAPASPNRQAQKTTLQPNQAAHESIDDAVMDFNALPPLSTPSIPQDREVRDSSASQFFSESGERSDIGIMGNLPSSLIVSEASPTLQPISINAPVTYLSLPPPLPLSPSVAPVQHSEQTTIMPFLGGFADGALPQPAATLDLSFESTCRPLYLPRGPPNLHSVFHGSQAPIFREPAPSLTSMGLPMTPPRIGTCTVQEIISSVVISSPPKDPSAASSLPPPRSATSPVLKKRFRKCTKCQCVHVPTEVPIQLRLQCGRAPPDCTRDTQTRPLPPPHYHFLLPQRSRAQPSKRTRGIAQKTRPKPSFPCAVCGSNVTYKVWSVLCSTCSLWVHANCSKMNPVQIRKLPQSHFWICPTCHVR
ncbi:Zinc finger DBF type [Echinococcus multilocularis]|uniref:Zinc finger DBF type n=1 Tax=Echinococcus multilocularis TaxID=6211 RepID=A0A068YDJ5_ECHMU|nr:Zinc finger DBF type [Echinococcus multilocularis]